MGWVERMSVGSALVARARSTSEAPRETAGRFLGAAAISWYGDWLTTVALVVLLLDLTQSPAAAAGYMVARVVPRIAGSAVGGPLADRFLPQRVAAFGSLVQGAFTALILLAAHTRTVPAVFALVVLSQFTSSLSRPAWQATIPRVTSGAHLARVNGVYAMLMATAVVIAPALSAPLLAWQGPTLLIAVDVVTFAVAALVLLSLPARAVEDSETGGRIADHGRGALSLVWGDPTLRLVAAAWFASSCAATAGGAVLVLAAQQFGHEHLVGYLYAAVGAGGAAAALLSIRYQPRRLSRERVVTFALIDVVALAVFSVTPTMWLAALPLVVNGAAQTLYQSWGATELQRLVPARLLGRASAVITTATYSGMAVGAFAALALVPLSGWSHALFITTCLALIGLGAGMGLGPAGLVYGRAVARVAAEEDEAV